jgi:multidrug efflux pump subunit AcrB
MNIARFVDRHHKATYLIVALLCVAGLYSAFQLPSAIYPEVEFPRIIVVAEGVQLEPRNMVTAVARPLEDAVSALQNVEVVRVTSRAVRGSAELSIQFAPNTDMELALQLVQAKVAEVQAELPAGITVDVQRLTPSVFPIISYNVTGAPPAVLRDLATYTIRPRLARLPGVSQARVEGGDVREIEVIVTPERLAANHLTISQIEDAIAQTSTVTSVGRVSRDYQQYNVLATGEALSLDDVRRIVVSTPSSKDKPEDNGADRAPIHVGDVAEVKYGAEDRTSMFTGDGVPAAIISVTRQIGGNTVDIADEVDQAIAEVRPELPRGVKVERVYNQAAFVRASIANVRDAILIGGFLAVVILLAFLGHVRITVIAATTIPLTVVITFFFMRLFGQTFNLMSLGGIAVAIGLVIDDAVVIVENIERHLRRRTAESRRDAIYGSVGELMAAVIGSTITTVVVFLPLVLLEGVTGQFFSALSVALTVAVLVSLVLALTLIPLLADRLLPQGTRAGLLTTNEGEPSDSAQDRDDTRIEPEDEAGAMIDIDRGLGARIQRAIRALERGYTQTLDFVIGHRRVALLATLILVLLGVFVYTRVETGFLPEMDEGGFVLDYRLPPGTSLAETNKVISQIEQILKETPEVAAFSRRTGSQLGFFATDPNEGDILVRLKDNRKRDSDEIVDDLRSEIEQKFPQAHAEFVKLLEDVINDLAGEPRPVEIKLFGNDLQVLQRTSTELGDQVEKIPGIVEMFNGVSEGSPELVARIDPVRAGRAGLTVQAISTQLNEALLGKRVTQIREGDRLVGVRVRLPDETRFDFSKISNVPITTPNGLTQPLSAYADVKREAGQGELVRQDQRQMVAVTAGLSGRGLGSVTKDIRALLNKTNLPPGVTYQLGGQYESQQTAFRGLLTVFGLALALVFIVLVVQFRSYLKPLIILFAAPVSLVGALLALWVTRTPLNISSFMGLIMLLGLVVKNGIILLDYTDRLRAERDMPLHAALREAGRVRLRPILMTTLCTIFGLAPLAIGLGAGAELQRPLAIAVIGGLTLSTFITLLVVPTLALQLEGLAARQLLSRWTYYKRGVET